MNTLKTRSTSAMAISAFLRGVAFFFLGLFSAESNAIVQGNAGEALLVPFVLYDAARGTNTVIRIKVPEKVGVDFIANNYTAPHTSPSSSSLPSVSVKIHWAFFNADGLHLLDGYENLLPEQVYVFDWRQKLVSFGQASSFTGKPGYVIIVTEAGAQGNTADFNMYGDAAMSFQGSVATIPVVPMADGSDQIDSVYATAPYPGNEVIEHGMNSSWYASPLSAGMRTGTADSEEKVNFDLQLDVRNPATTGITSLALSRHNTLLVFWNDRKISNWVVLGILVKEDGGDYCSDYLSHDKNLNLTWIKNRPSEAAGPSYFTNKLLCYPPPPTGMAGYVAVDAPAVSDPNSAAIGFSLFFDRPILSLPGTKTAVRSVLAHERGLSGFADK